MREKEKNMAMFSTRCKKNEKWALGGIERVTLYYRGPRSNHYTNASFVVIVWSKLFCNISSRAKMEKGGPRDYILA